MDKFLPSPDLLPNHAFIVIGARGVLYKTDDAAFEARLLEATLFEDTCALFNAAKDANSKLSSHRSRTATYWIYYLFRIV